MIKFYVVVQGEPPGFAERIAAAVQDKDEDEETENAKPLSMVKNLKDGVKVVGVYLDRVDAEMVARDLAEKAYPDPIYVLDPFARFQAEDRPVNRHTIY